MTKMTGTAGYAIKKVALLSLGEVFADILPEYRVKEDAKPTANGPKLKKETRELMAYERTLLKLWVPFWSFPRCPRNTRVLQTRGK